MAGRVVVVVSKQAGIDYYGRHHGQPFAAGACPWQGGEKTATAAPPMPVVPPPSLATNSSQHPISQSPPNHRPTSPNNNNASASGLLQNVASWAASRAGFDSAMTEEFVGSFVDGRPVWAPVRAPRDHDVPGSGISMGMGRDF